MQKVLFYSSQDYDKDFFDSENKIYNWQLDYTSAQLNEETTVLAKGYTVICVFVNDIVNKDVLEKLNSFGIKIIALRCAGFNNVDIKAAEELGISVVRVPNYSPYSVAEHTIALISTLNRKIHRSYTRVKEGNFSLNGLLGVDLHGKTVGIIGTGNIGSVVACILHGFGMKLLGYDLTENKECLELGLQYTGLDNLLKQSDVITLHCPLTPDTHHLINDKALAKMKSNALLINTSRGAVIDTTAVINALKSKKIAGLALDVYEHESGLFFKNLSDQIITDDTLERLTTFPNVVLTSHQGFFTVEAMQDITKTTLENINLLTQGKACANCLKAVDLLA